MALLDPALAHGATIRDKCETCDRQGCLRVIGGQWVCLTCVPDEWLDEMRAADDVTTERFMTAGDDDGELQEASTT